MNRSTIAALAGSSAIGLLAASGPAWAQAADAQTVEQLQAVIKQQQQQLEDQAKVLQTLQQQVEAIQRSTQEAQQTAVQAETKAVEAETKAVQAETKAEAAQAAVVDDGEPLVTSGQENIQLAISGQVNRALNVANGGGGTDVFFVDNDVSNTRFRLVGTGEVNEDLTLGSTIEVAVTPNNSSDVSQDNEDAGDNFDQRKAEVYATSKRFGRLMFGKGQTASDDTAEYDLSGVDVIMYSGIGDIAGGLQFRNSDGGSLSGIRVDEAFANFDGLGREDRARYDTPVFGPGLQLSGTAASDDRYDVALTFGGDYGAWSGVDAGPFTMLGAVAWSDPNQENNDYRVDGSASFLHNPTGLNLTVSGGMDKNDGGGNPSNLYGKLGWDAGNRLTSWGDSRFGVDLTRSNNQPGLSNDSYSVGGAFVQTVSDYGTELFTQVRWYTLNDASVDDLVVGTFGSRIKF